MTPFPPIQRLCPYLNRLDEVIDAGFCRACRREVHDLTAMDERERADFVASRSGEACVSYTVSVKPALAAALIAASTAMLAAPDAALAAEHYTARNHHRHRPRPVQVRPIQIPLAGMIAPTVEPARDPVPPLAPPAPPSPPQKPD